MAATPTNNFPFTVITQADPTAAIRDGIRHLSLLMA